MNTILKVQLKQRHRRWLMCILLPFLFMGLAGGCAHQPWDIDTYIQNLERPERDEYQQPEKVIEVLEVIPGSVVADVGAGSGYFTRHFAKVVGENGKCTPSMWSRKCWTTTSRSWTNSG